MGVKHEQRELTLNLAVGEYILPVTHGGGFPFVQRSLLIPLEQPAKTDRVFVTAFPFIVVDRTSEKGKIDTAADWRDVEIAVDLLNVTLDANPGLDDERVGKEVHELRGDS